jgi:hypothetical protein
MRKIFAATLAFLPLAAAAAQPQPEARARPACDRFARTEQAQGHAVLREPGVAARRLDRLLAGDLHLTVERRIDGCHIPVIVRQNVGVAPILQR